MYIYSFIFALARLQSWLLLYPCLFVLLGLVFVFTGKPPELLHLPLGSLSGALEAPPPFSGALLPLIELGNNNCKERRARGGE